MADQLKWIDDDVKANAMRHDAERNLGCCGLGAAIPQFLRNS